MMFFKNLRNARTVVENARNYGERQFYRQLLFWYRSSFTPLAVHPFNRPAANMKRLYFCNRNQQRKSEGNSVTEFL